MQSFLIFCRAQQFKKASETVGSTGAYLFFGRHRQQYRFFTTIKEPTQTVSRCEQHDNTGVAGAKSSLLRFDIATGTWVVFSSGRRNRPQQTIDPSVNTKIRHDALPDVVPDCPFCHGNQHMTPGTLMELNSMRVVPNKYPAVAPLQTNDEHAIDENDMSTLINDGVLFNNQVPAVGFHEVVIESPFHNRFIVPVNDSHDHSTVRDLLTIFKERGLAHREASNRIEHSVFFKNHGATAGASIVHPHSQIVSTTVVPVEAQRLQSLALDYFRRQSGRNLYEQIVEEELAVHQSKQSENYRGSRVVDTTEHFVAVVPYASTGPYVMLILPRYSESSNKEGIEVDASDFTTTSTDLLNECSQLLHSCLFRLQMVLDSRPPDFNMVVQTAPVPRRGVQASLRASAFFRWHIRITPRLGAGAMAGFELGSGFFSNSHMPEDDAAKLRSIKLPLHSLR